VIRLNEFWVKTEIWRIVKSTDGDLTDFHSTTNILLHSNKICYSALQLLLFCTVHSPVKEHHLSSINSSVLTPFLIGKAVGGVTRYLRIGWHQLTSLCLDHFHLCSIVIHPLDLLCYSFVLLYPSGKIEN